MRDIIEAFRQRPLALAILDIFILFLVVCICLKAVGQPHPFAPPAAPAVAGEDV